MSEELKPCPFCGGNHCYFWEYRTEEGADSELVEIAPGLLIECPDCGLVVQLNQVMPLEEAQPLLLEKWNRRAEVKGDADAD